MTTVNNAFHYFVSTNKPDISDAESVEMSNYDNRVAFKTEKSTFLEYSVLGEEICANDMVFQVRYEEHLLQIHLQTKLDGSRLRRLVWSAGVGFRVCFAVSPCQKKDADFPGGIN